MESKYTYFRINQTKPIHFCKPIQTIPDTPGHTCASQDTATADKDKRKSTTSSTSKKDERQQGKIGKHEWKETERDTRNQETQTRHIQHFQTG